MLFGFICYVGLLIIKDILNLFNNMNINLIYVMVYLKGKKKL